MEVAIQHEAMKRTKTTKKATERIEMTATEAFETLEMRVGRVLRAEVNERARKPSLKLWIDFGPLGEKTSSAQLRALYSPEELVGRLVIAAVNLGTRNIAGFTSEVLVLGVPREAGEGVLLGAERDVPLGGRVY
jgi:tRNA-binding protein